MQTVDARWADLSAACRALCRGHTRGDVESVGQKSPGQRPLCARYSTASSGSTCRPASCGLCSGQRGCSCASGPRRPRATARSDAPGPTNTIEPCTCTLCERDRHHPAYYVARHDRLVRHIAAMLGKLVPTPDELDLQIVAGNLAAAVPECMGDRSTWCSSPSHTRPSTRGRTSGTSTIEGRLFDPDRGRRRSRLTRCAARPRSRSPSGQPTHRSLLISAPTAAGPRTYLIARTRSSLVFAAGIVLRALVPSSSTVGAVAGGPHAVHLSQLERAPTRYDLGT